MLSDPSCQENSQKKPFSLEQWGLVGAKQKREFSVFSYLDFSVHVRLSETVHWLADDRRVQGWLLRRSSFSVV